MTSTQERWLAIVGIGEDGLDGLSPAARRLIAGAGLIVGGTRHLSMLGPVEAGTLRWASPLTDTVPAILARRGTPVCVLASGDPYLYGVGATLARHVAPEETVALPAPSSPSLAAARLGWGLQECRLVSLHGRPFELILPHLQKRARLLVLSWDGTTPARLARLLVERGMGASRFVVMEALGGPRERILSCTAETYREAGADALNLIALEVAAAPGARFIGTVPGLPDEWFENDGQLTKRRIRALTLSALAPFPGAVLWDLGAGSGSVGIEWMLADPANRAIAVERRPDRALRIARNAAALGVPELRIVEGEAPAALDGLPPPDAIFVGGGGPAIVEAAWAALPHGARLVANAVAIETQAALDVLHRRHGGELGLIQIAEAERLGPHRAWRPALPIVQWSVTRP